VESSSKIGGGGELGFVAVGAKSSWHCASTGKLHSSTAETAGALYCGFAWRVVGCRVVLNEPRKATIKGCRRKLFAAPNLAFKFSSIMIQIALYTEFILEDHPVTCALVN